MTDLRFLSYEDVRKERQSTTRTGYKPRRCKAELTIISYHLGKRRNEDLSKELADKLRREVNTSMLYRWCKANMKDVLRS